MKRTTALQAAIALCVVCSVHADYSVQDEGTWPKSWPKELEPLRKQSRTLEGPLQPQLHYAIPFTKREEFEAAWPHLLKVKSKGAPVLLLRGPNFFLGEHVKAGVVVHTPPAQTGKREAPIDPAHLERSTYIELIVDGEIVDLNRVARPADTPIIDQRFKHEKNK